MDQNIISQFEQKGYQIIRDWLIKGPVINRSYQERDISGYLLWRQRIHPERRFKSASEAFREMGGIRSEYELSLRIQGRFFHPKDYGNEMELVQGVMIPGYSTYYALLGMRLFIVMLGMFLPSRMIEDYWL